MRKPVLAVFLILFMFASSFGFTLQKKGIIIPAYFYDSQIWDRLFEGKNDNVDFIVIVNPASGPGEVQDPHYVDIVNRLNLEGMIGIGYVHTLWGRRDIQEVKEEIDRWLSFYPGIKGFFLDQASNSQSELDYYTELYQYIKSKGDFVVVLNPGTKPDISYYSISDYIVSYESPYSTFTGCQGDIPEQSACIIYSVPEEKLEEIINSQDVRFIYITDDGGDNPYDSLPTYYEKEVSLLTKNLLPETTPARGIIIPAYFYDGNIWERLLNQDTAGLNVITIVNPASGPGSRPDPHYRDIISRLSQKGITPVGYVYTEYGRKPLRKVKKEIRKWLRFYPDIKGFFIDQVSTERKKLRYYRKIYRFIKRKGNFTVILSPGAVPHFKYYKIADYVISFVGRYENNGICETRKPEKDGCIVYGATYDQMMDILYNKNVNLIYVTDDGDFNPFDSLPGYLEDEIEFIKQ